MGDFTTTRAIGKIRVRKRCEHCLTMIEIGEPAVRVAGRWEGSFNHHHAHPECDRAALAYFEHQRSSFHDWVPWLHDLDEVHDWAWLIKHHPEAAARLNLEPKVMEWELRHGLIET